MFPDDVKQLLEENAELISDNEDVMLLSRSTSAFISIIILAVFTLGVYLWKFANLGVSPLQETWGQFGDFIGGVLNPAIGLVTVYLVLVNVRLQRKELRNSLKELKNSNAALARQNESVEFQNFQQTFFTWLQSYQALVTSFSSSSHHGKTSLGREGMVLAFETYFSDSALYYALAKVPLDENEVISLMDQGELSPEHADAVLNQMSKQWLLLYGKTSHHMGSILRTLYRLLKWIDTQPPKVLSINQKWQFFGIVRAQISDVEMVFLFFNGATLQGKSFIPLINKYAIFDNLDKDDFPLLKAISYSAACPYEQRAFNSALARQELNKNP
jgi:hypothetical protein